MDVNRKIASILSSIISGFFSFFELRTESSWSSTLTPASPSHLFLFLAFSHGPIVLLLVEDLLHLAVLQIVQLTHCILGPLDEVEENAWRTFSAHKIMLDREREEKVVRSGSEGWDNRQLFGSSLHVCCFWNSYYWTNGSILMKSLKLLTFTLSWNASAVADARGRQEVAQCHTHFLFDVQQAQVQIQEKEFKET